MAGRLPFDVGGLGLLAAAQQILHTDVPPLGSLDPALGGSIEQIDKRAMAPDRGRRYQSAADLAADLRACLEGRAPAPRRDDANTDEATPAVIVAQSPDGRYVAVGLPSGVVIVLDAATGASLASICGDGTLERLSFESASHLTIGRSGGRIDRAAIPVTD
jgi:hypothetical protein